MGGLRGGETPRSPDRLSPLWEAIVAEGKLLEDCPIVTREDAVAKGLKRFFVGEPCVHGHLAERFVSSKRCVECSYLGRDDYRRRNPDQASEYTRAYYEANREVVKAKRRDSYSMNCPNCGDPIEVREQRSGTQRNRRVKFCSLRCRLDFIVDKSPGHGPNGDCWVAVGSKHNFGYGWINVSEKKETNNRCAHVVSWELEHGPVPSGLYVLHRCDYPPCCRPDHLFLGTQQDNMDDKVAKDRQLRGEQIPQSKLTEEDVRRIRKDDRSHLEIAADYGVSHHAIANVKSGKSWKHVK